MPGIESCIPHLASLIAAAAIAAVAFVTAPIAPAGVSAIPAVAIVATKIAGAAAVHVTAATPTTTVAGNSSPCALVAPHWHVMVTTHKETPRGDVHGARKHHWGNTIGGTKSSPVAIGTLPPSPIPQGASSPDGGGKGSGRRLLGC